MGLNRAGGGIWITFSRHSPVWLAFHFATHKMDRDAPRLGFFHFFYLTVSAKTTWKLHDNTTSLSTCLWQHAFSRFSEIFPWILFSMHLTYPCRNVDTNISTHSHAFPKGVIAISRQRLVPDQLYAGFCEWDREKFRKVIEGYIRYSKFI